MVNLRVSRIIENALNENSADAYIIVNPYNIKYVSEITLHGAPPLMALVYTKDGELYGITSPLEENRARDLFDGELIVFTRSRELPWEYMESREAAIKKILEKINAKKALSDSEIKIEDLEISKNEAIFDARMIKSKREIENIEKAVWIAEKALYDVRDMIVEGVSEIEVAREILDSILSNGGQWASFDVIVASGPNAAYPHHEPTKRVFKKGEPVVIDLGAYYNGYASDITRTFFVDDKVPAEWERRYNCVLEMQKRVIESIKPEIKTFYLDKLARDALKEYLGGDSLKLYNHSTGHGIGLEVHEKPYIAPPTRDQKETLLAERMIFTVEPGVYIYNEGGIRIEDIVMVTRTGAKVLSRFPK